MIEITIRGAEQVGERLSRLEQALDFALKKTAIEAGFLVVKEIKTNKIKKGGFGIGPKGGRVPTPPPQWPFVYRRTGHLSRSITSDVRKVSGGYTLRVGTPVLYGRHLEFGTKNIRARGWLRRSLEDQLKAIGKALEKNVGKAVRG